MKIAFLGLGNMGWAMAQNLLRADFDVIGFDVNDTTANLFEQHGGRIASSASAAVTQADIVFTMLPNDQTLSDLFFNNNSVLERVKPGMLFVDCSTVSVQLTREIAKAVSSAGGDYLDAPVSGGQLGAKEGTLTFMIGGEKPAFDRVRPMLEAMGKTYVHMGDHGTGQAAKQCNNMLAAIIMAGTAEAIALGVNNGLDPLVLSQVMQTSTGGSNILSKWNPWPGVDNKVPSSNVYQAGFQMNLMLKDLDLAMASIQSLKFGAPMGSLVRNLFTMCIKSDPTAGMKDFSYIQSLYDRSVCEPLEN
ncbi:3-hydroxyisobutyrate dehydrogenase [Brucella pituitosa]|nr:3-hydroxyisobutyrate dehydrogenase [Brucella pituitosa]